MVCNLGSQQGSYKPVIWAKSLDKNGVFFSFFKRNFRHLLTSILLNMRWHLCLFVFCVFVVNVWKSVTWALIRRRYLILDIRLVTRSHRTVLTRWTLKYTVNIRQYSSFLATWMPPLRRRRFSKFRSRIRKSFRAAKRWKSSFRTGRRRSSMFRVRRIIGQYYDHHEPFMKICLFFCVLRPWFSSS